MSNIEIYREAERYRHRERERERDRDRENKIQWEAERNGLSLRETERNYLKIAPH